MANINIPTKVPGNERTAAEDNLVTDWINSPSKDQGALNPSAVVIDETGKFNDYTPPGNVTFVWSGTPKENNTKYGKIIFDGSKTLNFPEDTLFTYIGSEYYTIGEAPSNGTYDLLISYFNSEYQVFLKERNIIGSVPVVPLEFVSAVFDNTPESTPLTFVSATFNN